MKDFELGAIQERFADIVWANEPIASGELAKLCEKELNWKRPTTSPPASNPMSISSWINCIFCSGRGIEPCRCSHTK